MSKDPTVLIEHMLDSIRLIRTYIGQLPKEDFLSTTEVQDAVIRRIEIVGEAAKGLPTEFKARYSEIPWRQIAGMRDVLVHEYLGVDLDLLWKTVKEDLPKLEESLSKVIRETKR